MDDILDLPIRLLKRIAEWSIRYSPLVAVDLPDGLIIDASGCTHLWDGDDRYVADIANKLNTRGYDVRVAIADTIGAAWGMARFGRTLVVPGGQHLSAILSLPPEALRLESEVVQRLHKLGLHQIAQLINIPRSSLRRRFGQQFIIMLDKTLGEEIETMEPIIPIEPYQERLPCLDPILTATGIAIALRQLLETLCRRLQEEQKGLRKATFKCFRVDGKTESINISTTRPSHNVAHLFKLFEIRISTLEPALGIELFILEAPVVEDHLPQQEKMWEESSGLKDMRLAELIDRLQNKVGPQAVHRYLPDEHYWPERSYRMATSLQEHPMTTWRKDKPRPLELLDPPERIEVTAPIPDYPPMLFRYKGKLHEITKADGPERIEQEWWLQQGQHRDYYRVEDQSGHRYWLFRLGHYDDKKYLWFIHGFFP
jgi:protein ImuB